MSKKVKTGLRSMVAITATIVMALSVFVASARSTGHHVSGARSGSLVSSDPEGGVGPSIGSQPVDSRSQSWISQAYPAQSRAQQDAADPATFHWALLIGVNDYASPTRDNVGSKQDAQSISFLLSHRGWHSDHILLLTDRTATASHVVSAIRWLAGKTDSRSTVIFHYAGHEMPLRTTSDGDNEKQDVALWLSDNKLVIDGTLGKELGRVRAARMWIDLATCRAGGFADSGMLKAGRVITYSSPQREFSYEDANLHHSVFGYYLIVQGLGHSYGDQNHDGRVSVEEAFYWARGHVTSYTSSQQHPLIKDSLKGEFDLAAPAKPKPKPAPTPSPTCFLVCLP
jgi:caspase domain-containing protein